MYRLFVPLLHSGHKCLLLLGLFSLGIGSYLYILLKPNLSGDSLALFVLAPRELNFCAIDRL